MVGVMVEGMALWWREGGGKKTCCVCITTADTTTTKTTTTMASVGIVAIPLFALFSWCSGRNPRSSSQQWVIAANSSAAKAMKGLDPVLPLVVVGVMVVVMMEMVVVEARRGMAELVLVFMMVVEW